MLAVSESAPMGAAVERAEERQVQFTPGVPAGQFESRFDGFGAGIAEIDLAGPRIRPRRQTGQLFRQFDLGRIVEVGAGHVEELFGLFLDGPDHERMAVAGGANGDPGGEIEKEIAVRITDPEALGRFGHKRIAAGVGRGNELPVHRDECRSPRPRKRGSYFRTLHDDSSRLGTT